MERLEAKKISGHTYYYYSQWGWKDGKCRRLWQKYLGKMEDVVRAVAGEGETPLYADVFQWGLPQAIWQECRQAEVVPAADELCPKRDQGLTTGQYLAIAAVNRAIRPCSKRSLWEWLAQTSLIKEIPAAKPETLTSQRFWDHMDRIGAAEAKEIWKKVLAGALRREAIDPTAISYDGTNFYTFIDTFNTRCDIARRGKNKQGRSNLRQISYALFCSADGPLPLYYDVYEGNRNDAKQFPLLLAKFQAFFLETVGVACDPARVTLVFDKGNNSADNFALVDAIQFGYVGSVKVDEHKELAGVANGSARFVPCQNPGLEGTTAFRVRKMVYGRERTVVVTYNANLFDAQWATVQNDMAKAMIRLAELQQKLAHRRSGQVRGGRVPTVAAVTRQVAEILSRQHLKDVITAQVTEETGLPRLEYAVDADGVERLKDAGLGKNILISNRAEWDDERIILAYRSQYLIEGVFKEMKDREHGNWWPLYHWTDSKIRVHALYCTLALLLRGLMMRRIAGAGLKLSLGRAMEELGGIREVVNIFLPPKGKGKQKKEHHQSVLSRMSPLQAELVKALGLGGLKKS